MEVDVTGTDQLVNANVWFSVKHVIQGENRAGRLRRGGEAFT